MNIPRFPLFIILLTFILVVALAMIVSFYPSQFGSLVGVDSDNSPPGRGPGLP